jgi:hypothetical protein
MRVLATDPNSDDLEGCDRVFDADGEDVLLQLRPAGAADHQAISPNFVPEGEILGRMSKAVFLEAARALGPR